VQIGDAKTSEPLRNVIREYLNEKGRVSKERTNPERERAVKHFVEFLADPEIQIHKVDGQVMRNYKFYIK